MKFSRLFLHRLLDHETPSDTVVVIDVLRSFTTAAVALARGARAIYPVDGIAAASGLLKAMPDALSVGAIGGGDPVPGFDYGNSPARLRQTDLTGRPIVISTAAGVAGLQRFRQARHLYAAALVNAAATAAAIRAVGSRDVCFVITGEWVDRDGDEDIACADYIEALLCGQTSDLASYTRRVRHSDFGQRFTAGTWPNLPLADLELAEQVDLFDFAMPVHREYGQLVIRQP